MEDRVISNQVNPLRYHDFFRVEVTPSSFSDSQYGGELTGWKKSSSGSEVDFVVKGEEKIVPVECKAALSIKNSHLSGVVDFMKAYKISLGVVVGLAPFEIRKLTEHRKILVLPLYLGESLGEILKKQQD